jgi:hypothetical protein
MAKGSRRVRSGIMIPGDGASVDPVVLRTDASVLELISFGRKAYQLVGYSITADPRSRSATC